MPERAVVRVVNAQGVHARPISLMVRTAQRFSCQLTVTGPNGHRADARSALDMLGLEAAQGSDLLLEGDGPDAGEALAALKALIDAGFEE